MLIGLLAIAALMLAHWLGIWSGIAVYVGVVAAATFVSWLLLHSIKSESKTWKNYLAGALLPFASYVGGGTLQALLIKNAIASTVFGTAVALGFELGLFERLALVGNDPAETGSWAARMMFWLTIAGWGILGIGWLWLLKTYFSRRSEPISTLILGRNQLLLPLVLPPFVLVAGFALRYLGYDWIAFLSVWIPLLIILMPVILMALLILGYSIMGKPIRWN